MLKNLIEQKKCRKGPATGTTKRGAFWFACEPIVLRRYGGDGIGNSASDCTNFLQLRHYRDGEVRAVIHGDYWHQNGAAPDEFVCVQNLLSCETAEDVMISLKGMEMPNGSVVIGKNQESSVLDSLMNFGLPQCLPSPDDE